MRRVFCLILTFALTLCAVSAQAAVVVGMIEDASMHSLTVHEDSHGSIDLVMDDGTDIEGGDGLVIGERVVVEYYEDDYGDAENPLVREITILDSVIGKVVSATMDNVTIKTEDDDVTLTFAEDDDTEVIGRKGVTVGKKVEIAFEGGLAIAADVQTAKVWEIFSENSVSGEIENVTDDEIHLKARNATYIFELGHAYIDDEKNTVKGNDATIYFFGTLDQDIDVQQVRVHSVYASEPEPEERSLTGEVEDITMHQITVRTARGNTYTFRIQSSTKLGGGDTGIGVGDTVKCFYTGELNGTHSTQTAHLEKVTLTKRHEDEPEPDPEPRPTPHPRKEKSVTGVVTDASMNTLTIKTHKRTYLFSLEDGYKNDLAEPLVTGESVTVYYTGNLKHTKKMQKAKVTRIADS